MLKIHQFTVEGLEQGCLSDNPNPRFSFSLESDEDNVLLMTTVLSVNGWTYRGNDQIGIAYAGDALKPYTHYQAHLAVVDNHGEKAEAEVEFATGKLSTPWVGQWISDPQYHFTAKKVSPLPLVFKKTFSLQKPLKSAEIYATALGIYDLELNGKRVGERYFAPGFTSYQSHLQYQVYDVREQLQENNVLLLSVAGGWAVGSYVFTRINRFDADRQAVLLEIRLVYADGSVETIGSDDSFDVTEEGPVRSADFYDGESYDATIDLSRVNWHKAGIEKLRVHPFIEADYSAPVIAHETLKPVKRNLGAHGESIYDFGQNFAGVVSFKISAKPGQKIVFHHAEVLNEDGSLNLVPLRSAQATLTYIAKGGEESFSPTLTYMGFRYVSVEGIAPEAIELAALVLYSDLKRISHFECSDSRLNRLNENVVWSSKSNLMDIPTDCPQRDERMGWTGDIGLFAPTACVNFDMQRFLEKWLKDLRAEQLKTGGIPNTIPVQGYGFPVTMPKMAIDFWGDAALYVPWALYQAYGDSAILATSYESMRKYVKACAFWAKIWGVGKYRYIWHTPSMFHFGDWVAPDSPKMSQWQARSKYTATASLMHTSDLLSKIATILGKTRDAAYFQKLSAKVAAAYKSVFSDGNGRIKNEFQTAYVLPLSFGIFQGKEEVKKAASNLARLVEKGDYKIGTGFPGTPFVLFALADNGHADTAFKMLLNEECPSWLYAVKVGGTTIWEKFDGLDERGFCRPSTDGTGGMISFNHYASGSVAAFLYRRIAGLEPLKPGYKEFLIKPLIGGGLHYASIHLDCPYGAIDSRWEVANGQYSLDVTVPVSTLCQVVLPSGKTVSLASGKHHLEEEYAA